MLPAVSHRGITFLGRTLVCCFVIVDVALRPPYGVSVNSKNVLLENHASVLQSSVPARKGKLRWVQPRHQLYPRITTWRLVASEMSRSCSCSCSWFSPFLSTGTRRQFPWTLQLVLHYSLLPIITSHNSVCPMAPL
jgi:hypothetical protein